MGGKSRKTGGVSRALINRIKGKGPKGKKSGGCGSGKKANKETPRGLLDSTEEQ